MPLKRQLSRKKKGSPRGSAAIPPLKRRRRVNCDHRGHEGPPEGGCRVTRRHERHLLLSPSEEPSARRELNPLPPRRSSGHSADELLTQKEKNGCGPPWWLLTNQNGRTARSHRERVPCHGGPTNRRPHRCRSVLPELSVTSPVRAMGKGGFGPPTQ